MSSNPCSYMDYGGGDHQTADQGCIWLVSYRSVFGCRLSLRPIGCAFAVCDMNSAAAAAVCILWRYTSVIALNCCVCLFFSVQSVS